MNLGNEDPSDSLIISCQRYKLPVTNHLRMDNVNFDHLAEIALVRFLQHTDIHFSSFPCYSLWKSVSMDSPHLRVGNYAPPPWEWSIYVNQHQNFAPEKINKTSFDICAMCWLLRSSHPAVDTNSLPFFLSYLSAVVAWRGSSKPTWKHV